ncbi:9160_t:CDS:10 [Entrophospora sp. SA101]|nr:9160_t:CDS:10 [Entrophospora sp. SA101]
MTKNQEYYKILEISEEEAEKKIKEINEAYEMLENGSVEKYGCDYGEEIPNEKSAIGKLSEIHSKIRDFKVYYSDLLKESKAKGEGEPIISDYHLIRAQKLLQIVHSYYYPIYKKIEKAVGQFREWIDFARGKIGLDPLTDKELGLVEGKGNNKPDKIDGNQETPKIKDGVTNIEDLAKYSTINSTLYKEMNAKAIEAETGNFREIFPKDDESKIGEIKKFNEGKLEKMKETIKLMEKIIEEGKNYQPTTGNTQSGDKKRKADEFEVRQEVAKKNKTTGDELSRLIREAQELTNYQELETKIKEIDKYQGEASYEQQYGEEIKQLKINLGKLDKVKYREGVVQKIKNELEESGVKESDLDEETKNDLTKLKSGEIKDINKISAIENKIISKTGNVDYLERELKKIKKGLYEFQISNNVYHNKAYQSKEKDVQAMLTKLENYSVQSNTAQPSKGLFRPEIIIPAFLLVVLVAAVIVLVRKRRQMKYFITTSPYNIGCDSLIITHPQVLEASEEFAAFLAREDKNNYLIKDNCPKCGKNDFHPPRQFNLLLTTDLEITEGKENLVYLRPETCQGIFTNFLTIQRSTHRQLPFGIGQIGKSFRNEITLHHGELCSNSHRGNHDLTQHSQSSQKDFTINGLIPQVIEVSFGVERLMLAVLEDSYQKETTKNSRGEDKEREVLKLPPLLAPYFAVIIPLSKQEKKIAYQLYLDLLPVVPFNLGYEESPNIGKAYHRQDAIGTYYCLTVDDKTIPENIITLRHRDTREQIKLVADINSLKNYLNNTAEPVYDYKTELGEFTVAPDVKEVSNLISGNRSRLKTAERALQDKIRGKKLTAQEKEEVRRELAGVDKGLDEKLQSIDIKELSPEALANLYSRLYQDGKILTRVKAMANEVKLTEYIEPKYIKGEKVKKVDGNYSPAGAVDYFRKKIGVEDETGALSEVDLSRPLDLQFLGYTSFLGPEDLKKSEEGKETYGLTISTPISTIGKEGVDPDIVQANSGNQVVDTIAHELAHAVINSTNGHYEGQEGGGHGRLFYDYMKRIGEMIRVTPEFSAFEECLEIVSSLEKEREQLTASEISDLASQLSPAPELRKVILDFQQKLTQQKVLPDAEIKIFLTASLAERTRRRNNQYGSKLSSAEVQKELQERDERDEKRKNSPLKKTADTKKNFKSEPELGTTSNEIKNIIESITKDYGEGVITTLGESKLQAQKTLSTGSLLLDQAIGTGGYVCGKIVEIFGLESSGKSTLALHAVSECQKLGKTAAYIDLENGLDIKYVRSIGVKSEDLILAYPGSGEEGFEIMSKLIKGGIDLIIVDSVSNLVPRVQLEISLEKPKIGSHALLMSLGLRRLKNELVNKETIVIFINQIRNKISTGYYGGNPETTTGGMALNFDSDLRIKLKRKDKIEKNNELVGIEVEARVVKNKLAAPGKTANLEIIFAQGIKKEREIIDLAAELNVIQKSGTWYSYQEKKLGQGKENITEYLLENPELYQEIEKNVYMVKNLEQILSECQSKVGGMSVEEIRDFLADEELKPFIRGRKTRAVNTDEQKKNLTDANTKESFIRTKIALLVEIGELANELKTFKH